MAEDPDEQEVIRDNEGRVTGCRGRVLVALIVLVALFLILMVMLFQGMMTKTQPPPRKASAGEWISDGHKQAAMAPLLQAARRSSSCDAIA